MANTSTGPDKLEYKHMQTIDNTGHILTYMFNKCREMQKILKLWKTAHTVLIYKKGDNTDLSNFRSIALQSCMYKLFVAIVSDRTSKWANINNLLSNCQKGLGRVKVVMNIHLYCSPLLKMPGTMAKNYPLPG